MMLPVPPAGEITAVLSSYLYKSVDTRLYMLHGVGTGRFIAIRNDRLNAESFKPGLHLPFTFSFLFFFLTPSECEDERYECTHLDANAVIWIG